MGQGRDSGTTKSSFYSESGNQSGMKDKKTQKSMVYNKKRMKLNIISTNFGV